MATLSQSGSRRLYSWWWDSHITPKNSKWLQENLSDMDLKVKSMIKLIEEDADSFARRAEMYYRKRPELMKLVEEFYRAYRALAERYNHTAGELHHAQCTLAMEFSEQVPFELGEDDDEEEDTNLPNRAFFETDYSTDERARGGRTGKSRKKENERIEDLHDEILLLSNENRNLTDKDSIFMMYRKCLKELSEAEEELSKARKDSAILDEKSSMVEIEIQTLKESLVQAETEKVAALVKHEEYIETISDLESKLLLAQNDRNGLEERAIRAKSEALSLENDIARSILENSIILDQYKESLAKISDLEMIISKMEADAKMLKVKIERADEEISELKNTNVRLKKEKETLALMINELEGKLSLAVMNETCLEKDVRIRMEELMAVEEDRKLMNGSNRLLRVEADNLAKKIEDKDRELSEKQKDLENLLARLKDESLRFLQIEVTLQNLQTLYSQSVDERTVLELELKNVVRKLTDLEVCKNGLEIEFQQVRDDNRTSSMKVEDMENEIDSLRSTKKKLEKEVLVQMDSSESLRLQISSLKGKIEEITSSYEALEEELKTGASLKNLDEDSRLKSNDVFSRKLENIEGILSMKSLTESFLLDMKGELEASRGENVKLAVEKASLFSQLQVVTENMHRLLERNAVLENSLFLAKIELEGLKEKSKGLEEICSLLKDERSGLLTERGDLVGKLEIVETKLESMEKKWKVLEGETASSKVDIRKLSSGVQNEERSYDHELEITLKSQLELSVLKKFMKEMEEKNQSLIIECQKHVEASKMAERVISELESESLEQQVETELLLDEIERLRSDIYHVFRAVETNPDPDPVEDDKALVQHILGNIEDMKGSILQYEEDKMQLCVENLVLVTVLHQFESKGIEIEPEKMKNISIFEQEKEEIMEQPAVDLDLQKSYTNLYEHLEDKNDELKLWESEAEAFYFDLQVSSVCEVMFEDKVRELTGICKDLEEDRSSKMIENEEMKELIFSLENEIDGLKYELNSYDSIVASMKDDIALLEYQTLIQTRLKPARNESSEFLEVSRDYGGSVSEKVLEDECFLNLQKLQGRVKAVRMLIDESNKPVLQGRSTPGVLTNELHSRRSFSRERSMNSRKKRTTLKVTPKLQRIKNKASKVWNGMLMKDIAVDRVSSVSPNKFSTGFDFGEDDQKPSLNIEMDNTKIHERLASNAKKLEILQETVENLRTKMEDNKERRKFTHFDFKTINEQLVEAEETVEQLWDINVRLEKNIEENGAGADTHKGSERDNYFQLEVEERAEDMWDVNVRLVKSPCHEAQKLHRMKAMEQARKGSERIDRLQLEIEKIEYILMKLEDDKGKSKFFKSKTVILRDFMYNGRKNSRKRRKDRLCGCLKPSTSINRRSL